MDNNLQYKKIWDKTLSENEVVKHEFSVGYRYRVTLMLFWSALCLFLLIFPETRFLSVLVFIIVIFYFGFYLRVANAYAFTNKRVLIHKGWLSTKLSTVDFSKITDLHVNQPFFEKIILGTGNLSINTAGLSGHTIVISRIDSPYLIKKTLDKIIEDTNSNNTINY